MTTVSRDKIIEQLFPVKWRSVWTRWQGFKSEVGHWQYPWSEQVFTSALQLNTWLKPTLIHYENLGAQVSRQKALSICTQAVNQA